MSNPLIQFGDAPSPPPPTQTIGHGASAAVLPEALRKLKAFVEDLPKEQQDALAELAPFVQKQAPQEATKPPSGPDAMDRANQLRQDAARELDTLAWVDGAGQRFPLKLTSSKYSIYDWLRRLRRGYDAPALISENEAAASRYIDAGLLIFLCANPPCASDLTPPEILEEASQWMDDYIPLGRQDESLRVANRLLDLTDLFVPVVRKSADEIEDEDDGGVEKKTHPQDGSRDT